MEIKKYFFNREFPGLKLQPVFFKSQSYSVNYCVDVDAVISATIYR